MEDFIFLSEMKSTLREARKINHTLCVNLITQVTHHLIDPRRPTLCIISVASSERADRRIPARSLTVLCAGAQQVNYVLVFADDFHHFHF